MSLHRSPQHSLRDSDPTIIAAPGKRIYRRADLGHARLVRPTIRPISSPPPSQATVPTQHLSTTFLRFALFALGVTFGLTGGMIVHSVRDAVQVLCTLAQA
jgi:hypothetical protein